MSGNKDVYDMLLNYIGNTISSKTMNDTNCSSGDEKWNSDSGYNLLSTGRSFYSYFTPVILIVGLLGNSLSLRVFLSKNMRELTASTYLAALSATDLVTLVFYVTVEWLRRGYTFIAKDTKITLLDAEGICQFQLYMSYVSRFLSSWIIVAFTMERYIGVCYPLHRRHFCSKRGTRKCLVSITVLSLLLSIYKPMLSGVYVSDSGEHYCTTDSRFDFLSFILDNVFVVVIAVVPFLIITILNSKIIISLILRNKRNIRRKYVFEKSKIKIEFTFTLFAISFCFIAFNLPFFCVWSRNFFHSNYISNQDDIVSDLDVDYWQGVLYITRTLFYINYCINTFLYSLTGTYFRQEVKLLFTKQKRLRDCRSSSTMAVPLSMPTSTSQTWV